MDIITKHYDIVIIGGGIAGLSACRHLLLKIPSLRKQRIAIIEPRSEKRNNLDEDYKVGESTVEVSAMFFAKELELQDYLIENHPPKFSLQFHWPKDLAKTDTMDDYYSTWAVKNPDIQSFQLNRCKIERDLLKMNRDMGCVYYHGRVKDIDLAPGDKVKTIDVQLLSEEEDFKDQKPVDRILITTDYVIDCSGRNFTVGSRTDNIIRDPKQMFGLENASTWVRVKNVDRALFEFQDQQVTSSYYYDTNHFFGPGYWIWMIPLERGSRDFSIGVSYHKDKISPTMLNSYDKFMSFLEQNQKVLFNLIKSGEIVDFHRWPRLSHTSKTFYSHNNWCVMGDAAAIFDPFYSTGMIMIAFEIECLTEMMKFKLKGDVSGYHHRVTQFDRLVRAVTQINNHLIKSHSDHLGNASIMSWRIYMESTNYFGILLPAYIGKYHLCPIFVDHFLQDHESNLEIRDEILKIFDYANENNINIGFMDNHRGGQLIGDFCPTSTWDHDKALVNCKYEHKRLNLPKYLQWTQFYQSLIIYQIYTRTYGISGILSQSFLKTFGTTVFRFCKFSLASLIHQFKHRSTPTNTAFAKLCSDFNAQYKYNGKIIDWKY
ncbi:hypothetical protein CYY_002059 [Polysphondylium violaceum]|uniref:Uncharacterized protein n=1 Tax=Polysphondylium violaceum TaxID=133409 RepID=A0A8J4PZT4_9MYCE|nr:hypothetical protein CYY_002059 [Polysphondylium violaceum]